MPTTTKKISCDLQNVKIIVEQIENYFSLQQNNVYISN